MLHNILTFSRLCLLSWLVFASIGNAMSQERAWASWCEADPDKGWHFYCDDAAAPAPIPEPDPEPSPVLESPTVPAIPTVPVTPTVPVIEDDPLDRLDRLQVAMKRTRANAVLNPTTENVEEYIRLQSTFLVMAGDFADTWRRVVWQNPDLDYEGQHPQSSVGKKAALEELEHARQFTIEEVVKNYALVYIGSANCAVCKAYGPDLKYFVDKHGFTAMPISIDGSPLEGWPNHVLNQGQLDAMGVDTSHIPLTLLYHRRLNQVTVLGVGYLAENELVRRIHTLVVEEVGDAF